MGRSLDWQIVPEHFIIVLPSHWNSSSCGQTINQAEGSARYSRGADLVIREKTSSLGPAALQTGGCGERGQLAEIPLSWLANSATNLTTAGRILSWEFLKLRFGVFSQSGFLGDPIYPAGDSRDPRCLPLIDPHCEETPELPSKHSDLCSGKSVREVVEDSLDFSRARHQINTPCEGCFKPRLEFVQKQQEQFIFLLETSATMNEGDGWKFLAKALKKLILYDLPDSARVGLVTFSEVSSLLVAATSLSPLSRPGLADLVPDKYRLAHSRLASLESGLREVIRTTNTLLAQTNIIIITANNTVGNIVSEDILKYLEQQQVSVSTLLLSSKPAYFYDQLGSLSGGAVSMVDSRQGQISRYLRLMESLQFLTGQGRTSYSTTVDISGGENTVTEGQFVVSEESSLYVVVEDVYSHLVSSVSLSAQDTGAEFGPFTTLARRRAGVNMLSLYRGPELGSGSGWDYRVEWFPPHTSRPVEAGLVVEASQTFIIAMWTSSSQLTELVTHQSPLALYVSPREVGSGLPVLRAEVSVRCLVRTEAGASHPCGLLTLRDDGAGSDLTADDGVYSSFLLDYPQPGRYEFTVSLADNNQEAVVVEAAPSQQGEGREECCGSKVSLFDKKLTKTGKFRVRSPGTALHLIQVPELSDQDKLPPARIRDLQVRTSSDSREVLAVFTAPGDDYDQGKVSLYKILLSTNRSELQSGLALFAEALTEFRADSEAGEEVNFMFDLHLYNEDVYLGVVAMDEAGNLGQMSNIVKTHIRYTEPHLVEAGLGVTSDSVRKSEDWSLTLALGGAIVFLASFLALGVLYFVKVIKSRKSVASSIHDGVLSETETASSISDNMMCRSLAETTPTFWSASFLLSSHERMISRNSTPVFQTLPLPAPGAQTVGHNLLGLNNPGYRDTGVFHQRHISLV